jgi:hypothetical protein
MMLTKIYLNIRERDMTNELQQYVDWLIEQGNATILQRNSRARKLPFGARLRGAAFESCLPLAFIFGIGYAATYAVFTVIEWVML